MYQSFSNHTALAPYLQRSSKLRAEALSRAAYKLVVGIEHLALAATGGIARPVRGAVNAFLAARRRRLAVRNLNRLGDHLLRDIGIHRGEIRLLLLHDRAEPSATR